MARAIIRKYTKHAFGEDLERMITIDSDATALALNLIVKERARQNEKFGDQSGNHPFEWMSILGEEFGELCQAVNETHFKNGVHPDRGGDEKIIKEAVHVAAVAVAIIEASMDKPYERS